MTRAGVVVSMNSDSDERARRLNIEAAKAMHYGDLTEEQALKLVTLNPAIQLGIQESRWARLKLARMLTSRSGMDIRSVSIRASIQRSSTAKSSSIGKQDIARRAELAKERATLEQAEPNKPPAQGQSPQRHAPSTPVSIEMTIWGRRAAMKADDGGEMEIGEA